MRMTLRDSAVCRSLRHLVNHRFLPYHELVRNRPQHTAGIFFLR